METVFWEQCFFNPYSVVEGVGSFFETVKKMVRNSQAFRSLTLNKDNDIHF